MRVLWQLVLALCVFCTAPYPHSFAQEKNQDSANVELNPEETEGDKLSKKRDDVRQAPLISLVEYAEALRHTNLNVVKKLLNDQSIQTLQSFGFTEGSMKLEAQTLKDCGRGAVKFNDDRAVVYFDPKMRNCSPYFMHFQSGKWRIDLYNMQRAIRFNEKNEWRMKLNVEHPYKSMFRKKASAETDVTKK